MALGTMLSSRVFPAILFSSAYKCTRAHLSTTSGDVCFAVLILDIVAMKWIIYNHFIWSSEPITLYEQTVTPTNMVTRRIAYAGSFALKSSKLDNMTCKVVHEKVQATRIIQI